MATPIKAARNGQQGSYNTVLPTLDDQDDVGFQFDSRARAILTLGTAMAGEDLANDVQKVEQRFSYLNIAAGQATTVVKSGVGFLHAIIFNSPATATNVTTVYDNTTGAGTVIAIPLVTAAAAPVCIPYNCNFTIGLTILTATANGGNMTVIYR